MLHVTEVLRLAGLVDERWFTEEARDRGTAVHTAARYFDEGDLDDGSVDPSIAAKLGAYRLFIAEMAPEILAVEESVTDHLLGYCGTLDRRLRINDREGVLDIKCGAESPWHCLQLMFYAHTFNRPMVRWNLLLSDDKYKLIEHRDRRDWRVCLAALTLVQWRNGHGA